MSDYEEGRRQAWDDVTHSPRGFAEAENTLKLIRYGSWGGLSGPGSPEWVRGYSDWLKEHPRLDLSACPVLRRQHWTEEDVMVAQDWALERGYETAALWTAKQPSGAPSSLNLSPAVVRAGLAANVEPLEISATTREAIETLGVDFKTADTIVGLIDSEVDPDGFESVMKWMQQCYNRPSRSERIMVALNEVLGGLGVEAIEAGAADIAEYVNMGETYTPTVVHLNVELEGFGAPGILPWAFTSMGDVAEFVEHYAEDEEEPEDEEPENLEDLDDPNEYPPDHYDD